MKNLHLLFVAMATAVAFSLPAAAPMGTAFTYQGRLSDGGAPADGHYDLAFKLFDGPVSPPALQVGADLTLLDTHVTNGLFTVKLDFGAEFQGDARWLEIWANTNTQPVVKLDPRQELTPQPYAIFAGTAGTVPNQAITTVQLAPGAVTASQIGSSAPPASGQLLTYSPGGLFWTTPSSLAWLLNGNGGTTSSNFLGTSDNRALEVKVNSARAFRFEPDSQSARLIGGHASNAITNGSGGVIAGGGSAFNPNLIGVRYGFVGGGAGNTNLTPFGVIAGGFVNRLEGSLDNTIGGGPYNQVNGEANLIAGGTLNTNRAGFYGTIGGGSLNLVQASYSATIAGGYQNTVFGQDATIGGGSYNIAQSDYSIISGGQYNFVGTTIYDGGGFFVTNDAPFSANLGGTGNKISSDYSGIVSGSGNQVYGDYGVIGGGLANRISAPDQSSGNFSGITIGGGLRNQVYGGGATIAGGEENEAGSFWSAIPGGLQASTRSHGQLAFAGGMFQSKGDAQNSTYVARGVSSDANPTELFLNGSSQRMRVPVNGVWAFDALIIGKRVGTFAVTGILMQGIAANVGGAMTTSMLPITRLGNVGSGGAWTAAADYNNTDRSLVIKVTGQAGAQIRWVATIRTSELIAP